MQACVLAVRDLRPRSVPRESASPLELRDRHLPSLVARAGARLAQFLDHLVTRRPPDHQRRVGRVEQDEQHKVPVVPEVDFADPRPWRRLRREPAALDLETLGPTVDGPQRVAPWLAGVTQGKSELLRRLVLGRSLP